MWVFIATLLSPYTTFYFEIQNQNIKYTQIVTIQKVY